jgi:hypothetical protein
LADRWLPELFEERSNVTEAFRRLFAGEPLEDLFANVRPEIFDPDTSIADYVWLPLRFEGEMAFIDWHDEWQVEDFD